METGYGDLLVGTPFTASNRGDAYLYTGGAGGLSSAPTVTAHGGSTGDSFGSAVAAGDFNCDGFPDLRHRRAEPCLR